MFKTSIKKKKLKTTPKPFFFAFLFKQCKNNKFPDTQWSARNSGATIAADNSQQ